MSCILLRLAAGATPGSTKKLSHSQVRRREHPRRSGAHHAPVRRRRSSARANSANRCDSAAETPQRKTPCRSTRVDRYGWSVANDAAGAKADDRLQSTARPPSTGNCPSKQRGAAASLLLTAGLPANRLVRVELPSLSLASSPSDDPKNCTAKGRRNRPKIPSIDGAMTSLCGSIRRWRRSVKLASRIRPSRPKFFTAARSFVRPCWRRQGAGPPRCGRERFRLALQEKPAEVRNLLYDKVLRKFSHTLSASVWQPVAGRESARRQHDSPGLLSPPNNRKNRQTRLNLADPPGR